MMGAILGLIKEIALNINADFVNHTLPFLGLLILLLAIAY